MFIELPNVGSTVHESEPLGIMESVKGATDVISPVTGRVLEANHAVEKTPKLVNRDSENEGWLCDIESKDIDISKFMDADSYKKYCDE